MSHSNSTLVNENTSHHWRQRLRGGYVELCLAIRIVDNPLIVNAAQSAGYDSFYVDMEHGFLSNASARILCDAAREIGFMSFVRAASRSDEDVHSALKLRSDGLIVPNVESIDDARRVRSRIDSIGNNRGKSERDPGDTSILVALIESRKGLEGVESIASVDGVDVVMVGSNDLASDLGVASAADSTEVHNAFLRTIAACAAWKKSAGVGGLVGRLDLIENYVQLGANFVSAGSDDYFLLSGAQERASALRKIRNG